MMRFIQPILLIAVMLLTGSCSDVAFKSNPGDTGGKTCEGAACPPGGGNETYYWYEGTYGLCSKPCGGGTQTATTECRRTSDGVTVADSYCKGTRPSGVRTCKIEACTTTTFSWNWGEYGACTKTCGGGVKTRTVVCQNNVSGAIVADSNCNAATKPSTTLACGTDACPGTATYAWDVTPGMCPVQCGGGTATDVVVCKKNDGTVVADSNCAAVTKPATTRACGQDACPPTPYTYDWEPQPWSICSKDCGDGLRTRSVACKRNDGAYVDFVYCAGKTKPIAEESCKIKECPVGGRSVTQTATVSPAANLLDVILVVDDSGSMKADQTKLAARLNQFVTDLDALNVDYQICLTTTDISYYKGSPIKWTSGQYILNKNTANKNTVFVNTVNALGAEYSSDEQGIKATYLMIKDFGPASAANAGCFRPKATLTVIAISDEDERSVGGNASLSTAQYKPLTPENYPDALINYVHSTFDSAGFVKPFIWNSIIVKPGDTACEAAQDSQGNPSFPGVLLAQIANKTNGQVASICDADYANNMKLIKERVVNSMPGITLQCVPTDNPIVTYSPAFTTTVTRTGAELKFNPALPENTQVTIKYTCPN